VTPSIEPVVKTFQRALASHPPLPWSFGIRGPDGREAQVGDGPPAATLVVRDGRGAQALRALDSLAVGEAYLRGALDVEGDFARLLSLRGILFRNRHPLLSALRFVRPLVMGQARADRAAIAEHYDEDPDFFTLFLDRRHRAYSQGVFASDDEPLEDAITRKMEYALDAVGARPGDRVLDIGAGWGAFSEFAGKRGVQVTSLTISEPSRAYVQALIDRERLPCHVRMEHLMEHAPVQPYDAIVNLGVTEHLPHYAATLRAYHRLLKPGGAVYLDASATRQKYRVSAFFERHVFRGNGTPLCLHDYLAALARSPLELVSVLNDRHNYMLTAQAWARNLDAHRDEIERRWGQPQFRRFRVYLWGCVDGFRRDLVQAYRWVLRKPAA
jgi:cyclopropane-fatty-acyl-phospholipid synthase